MFLKSQFLRSVALPAMLAFGAVSAPALADVPAVGQCGPAEVVKAELTKAGYHNYFVYDTELFDEKRNATVWLPESVYANDGMTKGYHVGRRGENGKDICVFGALRDFIIADNVEQEKARAIDPRFFKDQPNSNVKNGLNYALKVGAERVGEYPVIQARIRHSNGGEGYLTIAANSRTHDGGRILSDFSGKIVALDSGIEVGKRPQTGFTPAAQSVLVQMKGEKRVDAGSSPAVLASAVPALR
ncbi:MAG: hypothetical protein JNN09_02295 [Alphaproteobacteria bacterium]|nr:hypothetical protein [Alphaproteobacteria bacterium]